MPKKVKTVRRSPAKKKRSTKNIISAKSRKVLTAMGLILPGMQYQL